VDLRTAIAFAFLALAAGASAGAGGALAPPVIHEPFTPLPCPMHPASTIEIEGCQEHALLRSDRAVNARTRTIFYLLGSHSARAAFVRGETSWLNYRRGSCEAQASRYAGGTAEPVEFAACELARNHVHLGELGGLLRTLRTR
jgi:uncharacterized protein YecT (DUF1311 family)